MPLQICEECGWMHWHNDPCRTPKRSTAARKDVRQRTEAMTEDAPHLSASKLSSAPTLTRTNAIAGTQALPVDASPQRSVGRPKTITDMKAYKAMKAKEYRAKAKAIRLETIKANG